MECTPLPGGAYISFKRPGNNGAPIFDVLLHDARTRELLGSCLLENEIEFEFKDSPPAVTLTAQNRAGLGPVSDHKQGTRV